MPLLLRTVKQNRWYRADAEPFLAQDDVPADCFVDLPTKENLLSVWEVQPDRSNLERVVRAVAVGRSAIDNMGYVVVESEHLEKAGIEILPNAGESFDKDANAWHRDLVLSGNKLVELTKAMLLHGESGQILKLRMKQIVADGITAGELPESVRKTLEKK